MNYLSLIVIIVIIILIYLYFKDRFIKKYNDKETLEKDYDDENIDLDSYILPEPPKYNFDSNNTEEQEFEILLHDSKLENEDSRPLDLGPELDECFTQDQQDYVNKRLNFTRSVTNNRVNAMNVKRRIADMNELTNDYNKERTYLSEEETKEYMANELKIFNEVNNVIKKRDRLDEHGFDEDHFTEDLLVSDNIYNPYK